MNWPRNLISLETRNLIFADTAPPPTAQDGALPAGSPAAITDRACRGSTSKRPCDFAVSDIILRACRDEWIDAGIDHIEIQRRGRTIPGVKKQPIPPRAASNRRSDQHLRAELQPAPPQHGSPPPISARRALPCHPRPHRGSLINWRDRWSAA
jgi:hypothetical protein